MTNTQRLSGAVALVVIVHAHAVSAQESRFIDVGSHRLHAVVSGEGTPVVVLEAGLGEGLDTWNEVRDRIARYTTVIAYSRAGYGESEASPHPRSPAQISDELGALLQRLSVPEPVVLVGHSLGGLYARVFAARHPDRVAGLVLVDGTHERQYQVMSQLSDTFWQDTKAVLDDYAATQGGATAAELEEEWLVLERGALPEAYPLPSVPTVALSAQRPDSTWVGDTESGLQLWRELHQDYLQFSGQARQVLVPESGHLIHREAPTLVVEVVRQVVTQVRQAR